jgi:hypothetical protein
LNLQAIETLGGVNFRGEVILQDLLVAGLEEGEPSTCFTKDKQAHLGDWKLFVVVVSPMLVACTLFLKLEVFRKKSSREESGRR